MKVIINNIKIYQIRDNRYYNNGNNNELNVGYGTTEESELTENVSHIIIDDNPTDCDNQVIAQLKECILKSEADLKELIDQLSNG